MTHEDTGKYGKKRSGAELNERIGARIREKASEKRLSCAEAHSIAETLNVPRLTWDRPLTCLRFE